MSISQMSDSLRPYNMILMLQQHVFYIASLLATTRFGTSHAKHLLQVMISNVEKVSCPQLTTTLIVLQFIQRARRQERLDAKSKSLQLPPSNKLRSCLLHYPSSSDHHPSTIRSLFDPPPGLEVYATTSLSSDPTSYSDAMSRPDARKWEGAMDKEIDSIECNNTWKLCELPPGRKAIGSKWVYKKKIEANGDETYKARVVAKGYAQVAELDYNDTYAPVVHIETVHVFLALVSFLNLYCIQGDFVTAFLNSNSDLVLYLTQPEGYVNKRLRHVSTSHSMASNNPHVSGICVSANTSYLSVIVSATAISQSTTTKLCGSSSSSTSMTCSSLVHAKQHVIKSFTNSIRSS